MITEECMEKTESVSQGAAPLAVSEFDMLYRHSSHYLIGRVILLLLGFVSFPLFTRLFSVAEYGLMSLVLKIVGTCTAFAKLGIQNSVLRFYEEETSGGNSNSLRCYYSTLFFGPLAIAAAVAFVFILGVKGTPSSLVSPQVKKLLIFTSGLIVIRAMWSIVMAFLRVEGKTKSLNLLDVITKLGSIALICILFFTWKRDLTAFFAGTILVEFAVVLAASSFLFRRRLLSFRRVDPEFLKTVAVFGLPFVIYEFGSWILDSGDRVLVQHYLGAQMLGYYSAAYAITGYIDQGLTMPVNMALMPIYMKLWITKGKEETQAFLSRSLDIFLIIAIGICCIATAVSHDAIIILASRKYQEAHRLLPVLIASIVVWSVQMFLVSGLIIHKRTFKMAMQLIYAGALNIVLNMILLPRIGVMGAALATLISYSFAVVLSARASFSLLPLRIGYLACAKYIGAAVLAGAVVSQVQLENIYWGLLIRGLLSVLLYVGLLCLAEQRVRSFVINFVRSELLRTRKPEMVTYR